MIREPPDDIEYDKRLTVRQLIEKLQALPPEHLDKDVTCTYDCGYATGVYDVDPTPRQGVIWLVGD